MVKAVLFDFRGTLVETTEAKRNALLFLYNFVRLKHSDVSLEEFIHLFERTQSETKEKFIANTAIHNWNLLVISSLFSKLGINAGGRELQKLVEGFDAAFVEKTKLFSEVVSMLKFLKSQDIKLGVVIDGTSKRERAVLAKLGVIDFFNVIIISEEVGRNKLSIVPLQSAIEQMQLPPSEIIVVGDRIDKDILPANKLGCISVLLQRGAGQKLENIQREAMPMHAISKINELANFLDWAK